MTRVRVGLACLLRPGELLVVVVMLVVMLVVVLVMVGDDPWAVTAPGPCDWARLQCLRASDVGEEDCRRAVAVGP